MDFEQLYLMQKKLNDKIINAHQLQNKELYYEHLFALIVEIGELANETRCFKYWSVKPPSEHSVILEEYVDGLHFILSIGLDLGFTKYEDIDKCINNNLVSQFLYLYKIITMLQENKEKEIYNKLISTYLGLGAMLEFSEQEIFIGYCKKNEENHERQKKGY
ncbi:dUTP diphosphatase [Fictibacillus sp. FJAT-27399]|uniref:dUTP diphosphatase n=1 Tax=Fictibacillus sp. FJAT-27399 TaxID=1729689 RepID=UPI0007832DA8|nr:dUTP diphosphatase [Fictibacillus sp. FJAT-27399]